MGVTETKEMILNNKTALGIEFGSTRIKAVLVDETNAPIASGSYDWENRLEDGIWTYHLEDIKAGLQGSYKALAEDVRERYESGAYQRGSSWNQRYDARLYAF